MSQLREAKPAGRRSAAARSKPTLMILGCALVAWVALSVAWAIGSWGSGAAGTAGTHPHHAHLSPESEGGDPFSAAWIGMWLLMVVAMMWPLTVPTVGAINRSSFRDWRLRLSAVCLAAVTVLWLVVGLAGAIVAGAFSVPPGSLWWQLAFIGLALAAFRSSRRSRLLEQCLRLPALAPGGRRGMRTAVRAGVVTWRRCALLCGPLMVAMIAGHSLVLMVCASAAVWWEAWHPRAWRDPVPVLLVSLAGAWLAFSALVDGRVSDG